MTLFSLVFNHVNFIIVNSKCHMKSSRKTWKGNRISPLATDHTASVRARLSIIHISRRICTLAGIRFTRLLSRRIRCHMCGETTH